MSSERLLVVDDEGGMLRSVERVLGGPYKVTSARTSREALALAAQQPFDLAIVDIRMPELDGFGLVARLRERQPDLDVIFMTGLVHELDEQLVRAIREKAFYFIQKPFDREVLLTLVGRCLEVRRLAAQNRQYVQTLEEELGAARAFQRSLLPAGEARLDGLAIAARCRPCEALSGDLYDYVRVGPGRASVLLADVSGHGVSAAMLLGVVKSAFHDVVAERFEPAAVVRNVAAGMRPFDDDRFVTVFCARLDRKGRRLEYVNAGHPAGLLWGADRALTELARTGPMISPAVPEASWERREVELLPGDRLLLYTDGITEAKGEAGPFGGARLRACVEAHPEGGAGLLDHLLAAVDEHGHGRPASDDRSLLAVTVAG